MIEEQMLEIIQILAESAGNQLYQQWMLQVPYEGPDGAKVALEQFREYRLQQKRTARTYYRIEFGYPNDFDWHFNPMARRATAEEIAIALQHVLDTPDEASNCWNELRTVKVTETWKVITHMTRTESAGHIDN